MSAFREGEIGLDPKTEFTLSEPTIRVLHLDDEEQQQMFLKIFVESDSNIKVTSARNAEDALELVQTGAYDCLISDYDMPDMNGITLAKKIRETSSIPIIIYTGRGSEEVAEQAYSVGINDYIRKENHPAHYQVLIKRIKHVVERVRAEKALKESEERYRVLVDNSPYAISVTVGDQIVYANRSRAALAGVDDPSKIIGLPSQFQVSQEDRGAIQKRKKSRESGAMPSSQFTFRLVTKDGSIRYVVDYSLEIVYGGEKAVQHMLMDITEHRLYGERLEALHRNELDLIEAQTLGDVAELTLDAVERTLGFDRCGFGVVEGNLLRFSRVRGVEGVADLPLSGRGITIRAVKTGETQFVSDVREDGDYVEVTNFIYKALSEVVVPIRVGGQVASVLNVESTKLNAYTSEDVKLLEILAEHVASSISRIKQIEAIKEAEETYRVLLDSFKELVALVSGTTITYINKWAAEKLGYESPSDLIGEDISKVLTDDILAEVKERALSRQRGEPQPNKYELLLLAQNGRVVPVDASFSLITRQGKPSILVTGRDVSEMKRQNRQVAALHRHAERLAEARTKDEILSATLDAVESMVGFHFLSILEPRDGVLVITSSRGNFSPNIKLPLDGKGLTVRAATEKRSILTTDTVAEPNYVRGAVGSRSELDVPVVVGGEVVAVINLESEELNAFDEVDRELMETLALHVASALEKLNVDYPFVHDSGSTE